MSHFITQFCSYISVQRSRRAVQWNRQKSRSNGLHALLVAVFLSSFDVLVRLSGKSRRVTEYQRQWREVGCNRSGFRQPQAPRCRIDTLPFCFLLSASWNSGCFANSSVASTLSTTASLAALCPRPVPLFELSPPSVTRQRTMWLDLPRALGRIVRTLGLASAALMFVLLLSLFLWPSHAALIYQYEGKTESIPLVQLWFEGHWQQV